MSNVHASPAAAPPEGDDEAAKRAQRESHLRSLLKAFTWRIVATLTTVIVAYVVSGETTVALTIGAGEFVTKLGIYYAHERLWQIIPRGAVRRVIRRDG